MSNYSQAHICQCLTRLSTLRPNSIVTITGNLQETGKQFVESVLSLATGLTKLGLRTGDVVAICAFNSDLYLEWLLAVAFVGGIVAPLNYRWSFEEAKSAMLSVKAVMLVSDESCNFWYSELKNNAVIPSLMWHVFLDSSSSGAIEASNVLTTDVIRRHGTRSPNLNYSWAPESAVLICFTSGTTGRPKGVVISHTALIVQSLAKVAIVGYSEDDVYLHTAPLCHIGGLSSAMAILMEKETWKGRETLKKILNGGGSLPVGLIKDAGKCFPRAKLLSAYGMTESCSSLTFMTLYDPTLETPDELLQTYHKTESNSVYQLQGVCVGKPAPHVEIKICCSDGSYRTGRILTRGSHVMLRYWDQTPSKAGDYASEDWLDTGDIGSIDDSGHVWLIGRANNRIKSGGENVHPEEVEAILLQHPGLVAVVVLGIPDARLTEMVVACIRLREGWKWSNNNCKPENELLLCSEILQKYCGEKNLSRFKVPKIFIVWRKPFPITTTGKIRRDQIRREVTSHLQLLPSSL